MNTIRIYKVGQLLRRMTRRCGLCGMPVAIFLVCMLPPRAFADEASDLKVLETCVEKHFTGDDGGTIGHLVVMLLVDVQPSLEDLQAVFAGKRDAIIGDTARLMTRLIEQDCKPEFHAVTSSNTGTGFPALFQQLAGLEMRSLQGPASNRVGALLALDLLKQLDSSVALDLFGSNIGSAVAVNSGKLPMTPVSPTVPSQRSPTAPTSFMITVSSPDTNVLFGTTEQMAATASDGRVLTGGTWASDTPTVATITPTGVVTPVGASLSNISFTTGGQTGTKRVRGLPDVRGTFTGSYRVTSCIHNGQAAAAPDCASFTTGSSLPYTFSFTQVDDVVSGRLSLGALEFDNLTGTIDIGGTLVFSARATGTSPTFVDATGRLDARCCSNAISNNTFGGTVTLAWSRPGLSGQVNISGLIGAAGHTLGAPLRK
jgi:hypothetical protein